MCLPDDGRRVAQTNRPVCLPSWDPGRWTLQVGPSGDHIYYTPDWTGLVYDELGN